MSWSLPSLFSDKLENIGSYKAKQRLEDTARGQVQEEKDYDDHKYYKYTFNLTYLLEYFQRIIISRLYLRSIRKNCIIFNQFWWLLFKIFIKIEKPNWLQLEISCTIINQPSEYKNNTIYSLFLNRKAYENEGNCKWTKKIIQNRTEWVYR